MFISLGLKIECQGRRGGGKALGKGSGSGVGARAPPKMEQSQPKALHFFEAKKKHKGKPKKKMKKSDRLFIFGFSKDFLKKMPQCEERSLFVVASWS